MDIESKKSNLLLSVDQLRKKQQSLQKQIEQYEDQIKLQDERKSQLERTWESADLLKQQRIDAHNQRVAKQQEDAAARRNLSGKMTSFD